MSRYRLSCPSLEADLVSSVTFIESHLTITSSPGVIADYVRGATKPECNDRTIISLAEAFEQEPRF